MPNDLLVQGVREVGNVLVFPVGPLGVSVIVPGRIVQGIDEIRGFLANTGAGAGDVIVSQGSTPAIFDISDTFPVLA